MNDAVNVILGRFLATCASCKVCCATKSADYSKFVDLQALQPSREFGINRKPTALLASLAADSLNMGLAQNT